MELNPHNLAPGHRLRLLQKAWVRPSRYQPYRWLLPGTLLEIQEQHLYDTFRVRIFGQSGRWIFEPPSDPAAFATVAEILPPARFWLEGEHEHLQVGLRLGPFHSVKVVYDEVWADGQRLLTNDYGSWQLLDPRGRPVRQALHTYGDPEPEPVVLTDFQLVPYEPPVAR